MGQGGVFQTYSFILIFLTYCQIEAFESSTQFDKWLALSHFQKGVCYFMKGKYNDAIKSWKATVDVIMHGEYIDYGALHLDYVLCKSEVYLNIALAHSNIGNRVEMDNYLKLSDTCNNVKDDIPVVKQKIEAKEPIYPCCVDDKAIFTPPKLPKELQEAIRETQGGTVVPVQRKFNTPKTNNSDISSNPPRIIPVRKPPELPKTRVDPSSTTGPIPVSQRRPSVGSSPNLINNQSTSPPPRLSKSGGSVSTTSSRYQPITKVSDNLYTLPKNDPKMPVIPKKPTNLQPKSNPIPLKQPMRGFQQSSKGYQASPPKLFPKSPPKNEPSSTGENFKILAEYQVRKKIIESTFSSILEIKQTVIQSFGLDISPIIDYFDEDFAEFVELDENTEIQRLPKLLKLQLKQP